MKRICIINVYFGKYPNYFPLWLYSAERNSTIDFLLVTDQVVDTLPSNVRILTMTLGQFSERATQTIGLPIHLESAYKCCDFKVTFGRMFAQELIGYDFWGHCDVDLIWGDLRKFLTEDILEKYDRIYPLGHLSLYRNTEKIVNAFMLPGSEKGDYRQILTSSRHYAFDELGGIYKIYQKNNLSQYDHYDFADISPIFRRMKVVTRYVDYTNNHNHQLFVYADGNITRYYLEKGQIKCDEFAYLHLQKRKVPGSEVFRDPSRAFMVTPSGFHYCKHEKPSMQELLTKNPYFGKLFERIELYTWRHQLRK